MFLSKPVRGNALPDYLAKLSQLQNFFSCGMKSEVVLNDEKVEGTSRSRRLY
jgi:hypothetical protein